LHKKDIKGVSLMNDTGVRSANNFPEKRIKIGCQRQGGEIWGLNGHEMQRARENKEAKPASIAVRSSSESESYQGAGEGALGFRLVIMENCELVAFGGGRELQITSQQ